MTESEAARLLVGAPERFAPESRLRLTVPLPARGHMPFANHRDQQQVREDQARRDRQRYASPVWTDINQTRTLQYRGGRDEKDEQHISPLQLLSTYMNAIGMTPIEEAIALAA